ncbi:MAG: hypothetical protein HYU28_04180 [Actinobacteria bacterium]|nr:hypothetical protein [Actinomycetota bacterium]
MTATAVADEAIETRTSAVRWAGLAGAAFAVSVAVQNVWSGSVGIEPDPDAPTAKVLEKFTEHASEYGLLGVWVAVNLVLLAVFLGGTSRRFAEGDRDWARVGLVGGTMLLVLFPMASAPVTALAIGGDALRSSPDLVGILWDLHLVIFAFAGVALGIALFGLSRAAVSAGLVPNWFRVVGPVGAALITAGSVPVKAVGEGSPELMFGLAGFLVWLLFLVMAGVRIWREA